MNCIEINAITVYCFKEVMSGHIAQGIVGTCPGSSSHYYFQMTTVVKKKKDPRDAAPRRSFIRMKLTCHPYQDGGIHNQLGNHKALTGKPWGSGRTVNKDFDDIIKKMFSLDDNNLRKLLDIMTIREVPSGTILLREGEIASALNLVLRGCLRTYFVKDSGAEITSQFFIETQVVSSFESAMTQTPSRIYIDAIEDSTIGFIRIKDLENLIMNNSTAREYFGRFIMTRLIYYMNQHASFILDSPEKRYLKLLKESPELASRLPQQYIASFLGITPVSLSRIRARLKKNGGEPSK